MSLFKYHQTYQALKDRWLMARDFWQGGAAVLRPSRVISQQSRYVTARLEDDPDHLSSIWLSSASYLWRHQKESDSEYIERCDRAIVYNAFRSAGRRILRQALARRCLRSPADIVGGYPWADIYADTDGRGGSIELLIERVLASGLAFGRSHILLDGPSEDRPLPYAQVLTPLDLADWRVDDRGRYDWIRVIRRISDGGADGIYRVLMMSKGTYEIVDSERGGDKAALVAAGPNPLGYVPIVDCLLSSDGIGDPMACESELVDALDPSRDVMNRLSEADELERLQAFSTLCWPSGAAGNEGPMAIGPARAQYYDAQAGTPMYLTPPNATIDSKYARLNEKIDIAKSLVGVTRGRAEYSKEERSGDAISLEGAEKDDLVDRCIQTVERAEDRMIRVMADWLGESVCPVVRYIDQDRVSSQRRAIQAGIGQLRDLRDLGLSEGILDALARPVVEQILEQHYGRDRAAEMSEALYSAKTANTAESQ